MLPLLPVSFASPRVRRRILAPLTLLLLSLTIPAGAFAFSTEEDDKDSLVRSFKPAPPEVASQTLEGKFAPRDGETITLIGGTPVCEEQSHGYFETLLQMAFPSKQLRVRNIAWQADTVYRQQRPQYFYTKEGDPAQGSSPDLRERIEPGILVLRFGKMESLEGETELERFITAYGNLLDQLQTRTGRIVIVSPTPFFQAWPIEKVAADRNAVLEKYVSAIKKLAAERNCLYADLFHALDPAAGGLSRDGVQLSDAGHRQAAEALARGLGLPTESPNSGPLLDTPESRKLRDAIIAKNRLWLQYYRPTNWAFLFGDRQHVPSSRDHVDATKRWFVNELGQLPGLIDKAEAGIHAQANAAAAPR